jgi:hypothetical protein
MWALHHIIINNCNKHLWALLFSPLISFSCLPNLLLFVLLFFLSLEHMTFVVHMLSMSMCCHERPLTIYNPLWQNGFFFIIFVVTTKLLVWVYLYRPGRDVWFMTQPLVFSWGFVSSSSHENNSQPKWFFWMERPASRIPYLVSVSCCTNKCRD